MTSIKRAGLHTRLQTRIGVTLGVLIIGLSVVLALVLGEVAERRLLRSNAANLEVLTEQIARELSSGMNQFAKEVVTQTYRDRYRDPKASAAEMRGALEDFQRENPEFSYAAVVDAATGKALAATGGVFEGGDLSDRPVYTRALDKLFLGDVHDAVRLAELLPKPANGEPLRFLDVSAPIRDASGQVIRVFATHIGWEWAAQVRETVLGPVAARQGVEIFLIDTDSKVVLTASPRVPVGTDLGPLALTANHMPMRETWGDARDYLTSTAMTRPRGSFAGFGWKVVARQPYEVTVAAVRGLQYGFLAGGILIGLAAAGLAWVVTGRLVSPLRRLADQADREEAGDAWAHSMPAMGEADDVGEVAAVKRALNRLARSARSSADASRTNERQFEALAASLAQVVWQADGLGRLEYVNHDWIRAHQPEEPFFIADIARVVHEDGRAEFSRAWAQALADGQDLHCKCRLLVNPRGAPRWFEMQARAIADAGGPVHRWVGTLFDIDDIASLAEATGRALREEQSARAQSDRSARIRDEFLATVSHELRSPLNAITGWSDILARKRTDDPMIAKAAQSIRRNARQQAGLIDDLMDMTAVMAGKMIIHSQPVDLAACARHVFLAHLHAAQEKGVDLVCRETGPVVVSGESRRLEQVLSNLVGNALKFTEAGGRIEMAVGSADGRAVVQVKDNGRGIKPDFLPHVFERMRQEDGSVTRRVGGLGLGLAIARGIVELHCGTIEAASPGAGQGSTFTLALPLAADAAGAVPPTEERLETDIGNELQGLRVLLVDDEADAREVAHVALAGFGTTVRAVSSAAQALERLRGESFDVLVSDIGMPVMDGLSFIRHLRSQRGMVARDIPAVALTAFAMETDIRTGLAAGFQAYVAKPISLQKLYEAIGIAIRSN